ncbi:MAG: hypothetical protein RR844_06545 [Clostridium sp.]
MKFRVKMEALTRRFDGSALNLYEKQKENYHMDTCGGLLMIAILL